MSIDSLDPTVNDSPTANGEHAARSPDTPPPSGDGSNGQWAISVADTNGANGAANRGLRGSQGAGRSVVCRDGCAADRYAKNVEASWWEGLSPGHAAHEEHAATVIKPT